MPNFSTPQTDDMQDLWVFVPIDPESNELDTEGGFAEAFGGALAGIILGGFGLEHLAHVLEGVERWGEFQDALRPPISAAQVANAVMQWRCSGASFSPGEIKGVWIRTAVPMSRFMRAAFLASQPQPIPIPAVRRVPDPPRPRPRPSW